MENIEFKEHYLGRKFEINNKNYVLVTENRGKFGKGKSISLFIENGEVLSFVVEIGWIKHDQFTDLKKTGAISKNIINWKIAEKLTKEYFEKS